MNYFEHYYGRSRALKLLHLVGMLHMLRSHSNISDLIIVYSLSLSLYSLWFCVLVGLYALCVCVIPWDCVLLSLTIYGNSFYSCIYS